MSASPSRTAVSPLARTRRPTLRSIVSSGLDNRLFVLVFGALLPLALALSAGSWMWQVRESASAQVSRSRLALAGPETMVGVVVLSLIFAAWVLAKPQGRGVAGAFAVVLSAGTALMTAYSLVLFVLGALLLLSSLGIVNERASVVVIVILFSMLPAPLAAVLYFREARRAWAVSCRRERG